MNPKLANRLTRLYPQSWRGRYGTEFEALLLDRPANLRTLANVAWTALHERLLPTQRGDKNHTVPSFGSILKQPSALLPLAMSLTALGLVLVQIVFFGNNPQPDEDTTAHLWQILMAGQLPILLFFAIKWLPKAPRQTLYVIGLQAAAVLASLAPVFLLKW